MRALVVGGAGFVGSHLVDRLLADGHTVDVVDDYSTGSLANLADARAINDGTLKVHHLDVRSPGLVELVARRQPTVMYHLAVLPAGLPIATSAEVAIGGLLNLIAAAAAAEVAKIVVTLPGGVYYGSINQRDLPVKEGQLGPAPSTGCILARSVTELLAVYREAQGLEFTALATGEVYGSRQRPGHGVVASFLASWVAGTAAAMPGDGRQTHDLIYVDDTVDALARAAARGSGLVINIGTGTQTSARDLHAMICESGPAWVSTPQPAMAPARFAMSPVRARIHLAWAPWTALADGLAQTKDAYRSSEPPAPTPPTPASPAEASPAPASSDGAD